MIDSIQLFWLSVSLIIGVFLVIEPNAAKAIELLAKLIGVEIQRRWLMIKLHPKNPITNWLWERKMEKLAIELKQKIKEANEQTFRNE